MKLIFPRFLSLLMVLLLAALPAMADIFDDPVIIEIEEDVLLDDEGNEIVENVVTHEADGSTVILLTATGDFTVGGDSRKSSSIFGKELKKQGGDIHFTMRNFRDILLADDLTIVNFEGTLTNSTYIPSSKKNNEFLFSAPPEYVAMLSDNGVEAVSLENNHIMDHGEDAYIDTQNALSDAGIIWSNSTTRGVIEINGIKVCMLSYLCIDRYASLWDKVPADIAAAKEEYPIVIVSFHWGNEKDYSPTNNQIKMGRLAVDAGADLVLGHHSHRMNPIECYKGVYICYSLGNFCFAGNSKPSDMLSFVFQAKLRVNAEGQCSTDAFRIIPIRISSRTDYNDFAPTVLTKKKDIDNVVSTLTKNGKKLNYAVDEYPLEWAD